MIPRGMPLLVSVLVIDILFRKTFQTISTSGLNDGSHSLNLSYSSFFRFKDTEKVHWLKCLRIFLQIYRETKIYLTLRKGKKGKFYNYL